MNNLPRIDVWVTQQGTRINIAYDEDGEAVITPEQFDFVAQEAGWKKAQA